VKNWRQAANFVRRKATFLKFAQRYSLEIAGFQKNFTKREKSV
jgi:hypothetical protein